MKVTVIIPEIRTMSKRAPPDLDALFAMEGLGSQGSPSATPVASPVLTAKFRKISHSPLSLKKEDTSHIFFFGEPATEPTTQLLELDGSTSARPLLSSIATASSDESEMVQLLVCSMTLYQDLLGSGCPVTVTRWLQSLVAYSGEQLAIAAFKTLRGVLTAGAVSPGKPLSTPPGKPLVESILEWVPDLESFENILRDFGADVDGAEEPSSQGQTRMSSALNVQLVFELMAYSIAAQPGRFNQESIVRVAELAVRAWVDPVCDSMAITFQILFSVIVEWATPEQWPALIDALAPTITCSAVIHTAPVRLVRVAESLPPTARVRRLQRVWGMSIVRHLLGSGEAAASPERAIEDTQPTGSKEPAGVCLEELLTLLSNADAEYVRTKFLNMMAVVAATALVFDYVELIEADTTLSRKIYNQFDTLMGRVTKKGHTMEKTNLKIYVEQIQAKIRSLVPGLMMC